MKREADEHWAKKGKIGSYGQGTNKKEAMKERFGASGGSAAGLGCTPPGANALAEK